MNLALPESIDHAVRPLFEALPLDRAMLQLVVDTPGPYAVVSDVVRKPAIGEDTPLAAGLWLYVDQLDRSHRVSQTIDDATGSFWHGIMHRREGDFGNSHYWLRQTGHHPAMDAIGDDYDGHKLIDQVEAAHRRGDAPAELVDRQRREWAALFQWCANQRGE